MLLWELTIKPNFESFFDNKADQINFLDKQNISQSFKYDLCIYHLLYDTSNMCTLT